MRPYKKPVTPNPKPYADIQDPTATRTVTLAMMEPLREPDKEPFQEPSKELLKERFQGLGLKH